MLPVSPTMSIVYLQCLSRHGTIYITLHACYATHLSHSTSKQCYVTAAFAKAWDITLVVLAVVPLILAGAAIISIFIKRITTAQSEAYGRANGIASEALAAIRTVFSFNGEQRTAERYSNSLTKPMQAGIRGGFWNGLLIGFSLFAFLCAFALALWYGGVRVRDGKYTGGLPPLSTIQMPEWVLYAVSWYAVLPAHTCCCFLSPIVLSRKKGMHACMHAAQHCYWPLHMILVLQISAIRCKVPTPYRAQTQYECFVCRSAH